MNTSVRVLPSTEQVTIDHSFIKMPGGNSTLFAGWGPRL
jgi:hypothetical protein